MSALGLAEQTVAAAHAFEMVSFAQDDIAVITESLDLSPRCTT